MSRSFPVRNCLTLGVVTLFAACGEQAPQPIVRDGLPFDSVFELNRQVELQEPPTALITKVETLAVSSSGLIAVPDRMESQVRIYGADGQLVHNLGRFGDGPGEFERPAAVAFTSEGELYVSDATARRITRYTASFNLDTTFVVKSGFFAYPIRTVDTLLIAGHIPNPRFPDRDFVHAYSETGDVVRSFHSVATDIFSVPYWFSALGLLNGGFRLAVGRNRVFVGNALLYPISAYDLEGHPVGRIGIRPPSWKQASRPERGAFMGPDAVDELGRWLRTFTSIDRIELLQNRLLLVSHRTLDPGVLEYEEARYSLDIYGPDGTKRVTDVSLPGPLLFAAQHAYLLLSSAPDKWTLGVYALRPEAASD